MIQPQELKLGSVLNYWIEEEKTFVPTRVDWQDLRYISEAPKGFNESHKPIPLTEEILLKCGCKNIPHKVFTSNYELPLKRNKSLYITDVGTPNFMVGIIERDFETNQIEDCVNIHNFDFEKEMYLHQLQNLYFAITGKELNIKL